MPSRDVLDRQQLAVLGREWMLHGHLQDRVGMALLLERTDRQTMQDVAVDEWMAASPIYSRRMQRALGFVGNDVATIMKNLQLDIGAPHQFLDFRYRLDDRDHGEFWLAHCGALMDVEPMGEQFVHGMCHAIEDPTFDATAGATNPFAQVRPLHRPPRVPADRVPHCAWRIDVVAQGRAVEPSLLEDLVSSSALARLALPPHAEDGSGGWSDYGGPFDPDFCLEDLSRAALLTAMDELAVQSHLLLRSFLLAVAQRFGQDVTAAMLPRLVRGWCGLTSVRLRDAFGLEESLAGVRSLLTLHPMFFPWEYTGFRLEGTQIAFTGGAAHEDDDGATWIGVAGLHEVLAAVLQAAFPRVRVSPELVVSLADQAAAPAPEVDIARISTGAAFRFAQRRPVRV
ncbi:MAG: hypothetical protein WCD35_04065 [Mycobacteriales bacterium]